VLFVCGRKNNNNAGIGLILLATALLSEVGLRINVLVVFPKRKAWRYREKSNQVCLLNVLIE
jgi:hypothetical protein